jgi:hypothetical protein
MNMMQKQFRSRFGHKDDEHRRLLYIHKLFRLGKIVLCDNDVRNDDRFLDRVDILSEKLVVDVLQSKFGFLGRLLGEGGSLSGAR